MMRTYLILFSIFLPLLFFGQGQPNPFAGENTNNNSGNLYSKPQGANNGNGKPGTPNEHANPRAFEATGTGPGSDGNDPVPINDYIPVLILVALGMIIYQTRSVKKVQS